MGTIKGSRIFRQTFADTYSKVAMAKLYTTKTPITEVDQLNDRVPPFFAEHGLGLLRILTDRGTAYCGRPTVSAICFHKTILQEFYLVAFRRKHSHFN